MAGRQLPTRVGAATMAGGKDPMAGGVVMAMAMRMDGSIRSARMRSPGYLGPGAPPLHGFCYWSLTVSGYRGS
jgi:hypothetical protein